MQTEIRRAGWERKWKNIIILIIIALSTLYIYGAATAEMYRWVDENGETQISDSPPPDVRPPGGVKIYRDTPQESGRAYPSPDLRKQGSAPPPEVKKKHEVVLYGTSWCSYCRKARNFFRSRGIDFIDYDIETDREAAIRKKQLDDRDGVPFVIINGRSIHGFSEAAYERALRE